MIDESHFSDPDGLRDPRNPNLPPDRVSIKPQGDNKQTFEMKDVEWR